jgi:hypothetical protein
VNRFGPSLSPPPVKEVKKKRVKKRREQLWGLKKGRGPAHTWFKRITGCPRNSRTHANVPPTGRGRGDSGGACEGGETERHAHDLSV